MLQVAQTQEFLISTLPQSLFLFNGVELNYQNILGGIWIRGVPLFMLYHPISAANLLLVPSCRASFPWCYLCWSLGDDYRGRPAIRRCRHTNSDCEGRTQAPRRRMLKDDMLGPSTITFTVLLQCLKLSAGSQPVKTWGLFCICLQSFKVTFWESVWCVWLVEVVAYVCMYHWLRYCS